MKRKLFIITILTLCYTNVFCQFFDDVDSKAKTILAAHITLSSNSLVAKNNGSEASAKASFGYGFGVELMKPLSMKRKNWYINAMANFNTRGYKNVRANYLDFPITINYMFKPHKMTLNGEEAYMWGVGVYAGYALWGKYKTSTGWQALKLGEAATKNRSNIDYGFTFHAGAYIDEAFGILSMYLNFGLKNTIPNNRQSNKETFNHLNSLQFNWCVPIKGLHKKVEKNN